MHIGDKLLLSLTSKHPPVNMYRIMEVICDYIEDTDTYPIKRLIGYLLSDNHIIRRPPGCIQFVHRGIPYWRDGWNNLYSNRTCKKVGKYYPQTAVARICV